MAEKRFLYETLDSLNEAGALVDVPEFIDTNLASTIELREYQIRAFQNFITYYENDKLRKNKQVHTLFHMATGSGKTVIMAGLILYLYAKGYRRFLFFVNQTSILEKTKLNFTDATSSKYLFSDTLEYLGRKIKIKSVDNFSGISAWDEDIYICFTSTQQMHLDRMEPKENSLTFEDFEDNKIVFISDESHHVNSMTKQQGKAIEAEINSWEYTVNSAFRSNRDNVLLEFTATVDIKDKNVHDKYLDKIIMNYPLLEFRQSGYTKDFQNFATDADLWKRALIACVMSEYRRYLFADVHQNIKPVVLMKSQKIKESEEFYKEFFTHVKELTVSDIKELSRYQINTLQEALEYFSEKDASFTLLVQSLQDSFTEETSIIMNGARDDNSQMQILVNSLEDANNPIRTVFAVDMLNEGWDVLNLFDIVRLYDTRQGSGKSGKVGSYTIKEAQLIGRAARYCPFQEIEAQERFKRKYDYDLTNKYRLLETMFFHSKDDSRYITELRQALIATGLQDEQSQTLTYHLKDAFKLTDLYQQGIVFSNKRIPKERKNVYGIEGSFQNKTYTYYLERGSAKIQSLVGSEDSQSNTEHIETKNIMRPFKQVPYNILSGAAGRYVELRFSVLKTKYPNLKSLRQFLTSDEYLGNSILDISFSTQSESRALYEACVYAMGEVARHVTEIKQEFEGSSVFEAKRIKNVLRDKTITVTEVDVNGGKGASQNVNVNPRYQLDLMKENWYAFNDNYGTSEEKRYLRYFKAEIAPKLEAKDLEFFVVRNERVPDLAIYSFTDGERFEPDFLLFVRKHKNQSFISNQVYVEPKGSHLLLKETWKENFLLQINDLAEADDSYAFGNEYRIIGMPFFNEEERMGNFTKAMDEFVANI